MREALELKVPPLLLCLIVLVLMAGLKMLTLGMEWTRLSLGGWPVGAVTAALGLGIMVMGAWQFRRQGTTLDPRDPSRTHHVVSDGIYRMTRNPMYLGMAVALAGIAIGLANGLSMVCVAAFCVYINEWQIKPEERWLTERFGEEFRLYMARVRRWI